MRKTQQPTSDDTKFAMNSYASKQDWHWDFFAAMEPETWRREMKEYGVGKEPQDEEE